MSNFTSTRDNVNKAPSDDTLRFNMKDSKRVSDEPLGPGKALDQQSLSYKGKELPKDKRNDSINRSSGHEEKSYSKHASNEPLGSGKALDQQSLSYKGKDLPKDKGNDIINKSSNEEKIYAKHEPLGSGKVVDQPSLSYKGKDLPKDKGNDGFNRLSNHGEKILHKEAAKCDSELPKIEHHSFQAALRLQKVYKSFRTRRQLADCAVIVEQKWWKVLDLAELKRSSISFFDIDRHGSALSKWSRAKSKAAKVGKGLSKDEKARKLALQHWLEAIDPRHRYGHNLQFYYVKWLHCDSSQPFFYWLDIGEGRDVDLERCSRQKLQQQCIKYLGPNEREDYEVEVVNGKFLYKKSRAVIDTTSKPKGTKWIFVLSTCRKLYVAQKVKGTFQHSSFLAGGATLSAGRLVLEDGFLKAIWPHSGHYLPTEENFQAFMLFLVEQSVDLTHVQKAPMEEDEENKHIKSMKQLTHMVLNKIKRDPSKSWKIKDEKQPDIKPNSKGEQQQQRVEDEKCGELPKLKISTKKATFEETHVEEWEQDTQELNYKSDGSSSGYETAEESLLAEMDFIHSKMNMFSDGEEEEFKDAVPQEMIQKRINTHRRTKSYQLAEQLSFNWTTGVGPRIGCLRDYPSMLQFQAMEHVNLSPRSVKCMNSPRSASLGIKRDLFKVKSPLVVPERPKLGSVPEFYSPIFSPGLDEESSLE